MTVGVIGLGLIGGSMAKAIKLNVPGTVLGYDINETVVMRALLVGAIDDRLTKEACADCDLLILALFPGDTLDSLAEYAPYIKKGATVIDTCGVKRAVCPKAGAIAEKYGFCFVGAHPMAGTERTGFDASKHNLFENASMILVPGGDFDISRIEKLKRFFTEIGFSRVVITDADTHDEMIGYTSQLAHIVSSAYIKSPLSLKAKGFSAGSFRDMTRVATLNEKMWSELFLNNGDNLSSQLGLLIDELAAYKTALEQRDGQKLEKLLADGRTAKSASEESMKD